VERKRPSWLVLTTIILGSDGATANPVNCDELVPVAAKDLAVELRELPDSRVRFETDARKYI
jgi:hypothetical protein